jgi:raffinose/stachyose/melibiose transport system permease protein
MILLHTGPLYVAVVMAFKPRTDTSPRWMPPLKPTLEHLATAWNSGDMNLATWNSALIATLAVLGIIIVASLAAYPLARTRSKFGKLFMFIILVVMMIPPMSLIVPLYITFVGVNLDNSLAGIIILHVTMGLPLSIFLLSNFIKTIPTELDEAAWLDGCTPAGAFFRIILPQLSPVVATIVIFNGVGAWNEFQYSSIILQLPRLRVVSTALRIFFSERSQDLNAAAASAVVAVIPIAIAYLVLQKYFIKGAVQSAIK